ncbi:MAG: aconitate hydratase, partial [Anaerorhabdus sp.]
IHQQNLINSGILPVYFLKNEDYDQIDLYDELEFIDVLNIVPNKNIIVRNKTKMIEFEVGQYCTDEQIQIIKNGGLLNTIRLNQK